MQEDEKGTTPGVGVADLSPAVGLVKQILQQITVNDAPAVNEMKAPASVFAEKLPPSPSSLTRRSSPMGMVGSSSFETTETATGGTTSDAAVFTSSLKEEKDQTSLPTLKMGHEALAELCCNSLEKVQGEGLTLPVLSKEPPVVSYQHKNAEKESSSLGVLKIDTSSNMVAPSPRRRSKFRNLIWKNRDDGSAGEEKKDDEHDSTVQQAHQQQQPRLQQFGSEYARYLSHSQLAPELPHKPVKATPRQPHLLLRARLLEDADPAIQTGAILDINVTMNDDPPPAGYYRVSQSATGLAFSLPNPKYHLNVKKEAVWDKACQRPCVISITIILPDRQEFVPPGFSIVRVLTKKGTAVPANLNASGGERVYLCFRRSREGNPVTGLVPLLPGASEAIPAGYTVVERTPRNHVASLTAGRAAVFLAYRQRLANLETLRPHPLVQTITDKQERKRQQVTDQCDTAKKSNRSRISLDSYYCTGGTTVQSDIGRFHILDRTTHSLLSPSSVANRLNLIQMSRQRSSSESSHTNSNRYSYATTYARSDTASMDTMSEDNASVSSLESSSIKMRGSKLLAGINEMSIAGDTAMDASMYYSTQDEDMLTDLEPTTANLSSLLIPKSVTTSAQGSEAEEGDRGREEEQVRSEAMSFIPKVAPAVLEASTRLDDRITLLTPILTACYTRHGGAALTAVEGLTKLLTETAFFSDDADRSDETGNESSTRLTLLDLTIQAVCDVATNGAQDITFASCVEFVERAVRFAQGQLNTRTVGFVVRFYMFVFYFDASIPTRRKTVWPAKAWRPVSMKDEEDFPMLFDPREDESGFRGYLPGGAPQAAALALKELISLSIVRLGKVSVTDLLRLAQSSSTCPEALPSKDVYAPILDGILTSLVDNAVDHVERANFTQMARHQIRRSGGSELFWHDMVHVCGSGLFEKDTQLGEAGKDIYVMIFAMLQQFVKVSSGHLRSAPGKDSLLPKDLASKLLALELLLHFLEFWSDEQEAVGSVTKVEGTEASRSIETLAFIVRRTVVPCLLENTKSVLGNPQIFRRVIRIVSELWCSPIYRSHCKVELGILIEHFGLRILELGPQCKHLQDKQCLLPQQVELLAEIKNWFSNDPKDVIELYLNYDTDIASELTGSIQLIPGTRWQLFQRLCAGLSNIAEQCGELIGDQIRQNQSLILAQEPSGAEGGESRLRDETKKSDAENTVMREAARVLRRSSLEAMSQIIKSLAISAGAALGKDFTDLLLSWAPVETPIAYEKSQALLSNELSVSQTSDGADSTDPGHEIKNGVLDFWRKVVAEEQKQRFTAPSTVESLDVAFEIGRQKSLKKSVEYLIACNTLTPAPRDIANFLRIHKDRLDPSGLGLYLSESGSSGAELEYWNLIRYLFVRPMSFIGMNVEEGLRHFLTSSGFQLPGEAQRIDRLLDCFARCYFEDNAGDVQRCPFKDQDTVYLLVFAILMLNTDLHKSDSRSRKATKKMTKAEFTHNLKCAIQNEDFTKEYLSEIYDCIQADPIAMHADGDTTSSKESSQSRSIDEMLKSVQGSDSLLRSLAVHDFHFASIEDFTNSLAYSAKDALSDLSCSCVSKTWYQVFGVVNTGLETAHLDPQGMEPAVDILLYALVLTICLELPTERNAFLNQLVRLKTFEERRQGRWVSDPDHSRRQEKWYQELEEACYGSHDSKLFAIQKIYKLIQSLKSALRVDVRSKVEMTAAVAELINGGFLLHDPARSFLQSGDLIKKSLRTGRPTEYRFYLFSDVLLYASKEDDGRYKIHEELPLHLMKIVDWFPPSQKNRQVMFEVHHPRKTFRVLCPSHEVRKSWVDDIRASIMLELERKMTVEAARRLSTFAASQPGETNRYPAS